MRYTDEFCKMFSLYIYFVLFSRDKTSEQELYTSTYACLERAAKDGYTSIALPLISAGQYGGPIQVVVRIMAKAVSDFITKEGRQTSLKVSLLLLNTMKYIKEALCTWFCDNPGVQSFFDVLHGVK